MLSREQVRQTRQWQELNAIWQALSREQREALTPQFRSLTEFLRESLQPPRTWPPRTRPTSRSWATRLWPSPGSGRRRG